VKVTLEIEARIPAGVRKMSCAQSLKTAEP